MSLLFTILVWALIALWGLAIVLSVLMAGVGAVIYMIGMHVSLSRTAREIASRA